MGAIAIIGAQWGDEGKGKIIDILSEDASMVVRSTGGNNAGHTVVIGNDEYKLHLIPSGILNPDCDCIIGAGTVVDPKALLEEMDGLSDRGISLERLRIDMRAHIVMPYHIFIDAAAEKARGKNDIGTTGKGIGPAYTDKTERSGIRMCDFIRPNIFRDKLKAVLRDKNRLISKIYGGEKLDINELLAEYGDYARRLAPYAADTSVAIYNAIKADKRVVLEGAQGTLLDLDMGTYPFVTSSHPVSAGFCVGAGIGATLVDECVGIAKAYTTRVGKGPFVTELNDENGDRIRDVGFEFGTTTGRPRRCGWLDTVILRYAIRVNGISWFVLNKLDVLSGLDKIYVCTAYSKSKQKFREFPADINDLKDYKPVYTELSGWKEDISLCKTFDDLPKNAKAYINFIENDIECKIKMIGVGPDRNQNITR